VCAYCGARATEKDHVPPKALFKHPRPGNTITVPICRQCHEPTAKDDEYVRMVFAFKADLHDHPDLTGDDGVRAAALRSLSKPRAQSHARAFFRTMGSAEARSPAGLYLGRVGTYEVDRERVFRTLQRIVRGLFFHHTNLVLGAGWDVTLVVDDFMDYPNMPAASKPAIQKTVIALRKTRKYEIGQVFSYHYCTFDGDGEDPRVSAWFLTFYRLFYCFAFTSPRRSTMSPGG
jgi:hypothetical protein